MILSFFRTRCLLPIHATKLISSLKTSESSVPVIPWLHGIKSVTSWTSKDADAILNYGDSLYSRIFRNSSNEFSLVTSFPQICDIFGLRVQVLPGESYTGLVDSNANTPPDYNFETAISNIHQYGILTLGPGTPSFSMSIIKHLDTYFVFDPHNRNSTSLFCADGQMCLRTTHLLSLSSIMLSLHLYVCCQLSMKSHPLN